MRTTSEFQVGEHTYKVNMWHPDKAIENITWLTKLVGEPVIAIMVNVGSIQELMDADIDLTLLTPAVKSLMLNLNEKEVLIKVHSFVEGMHCDGAKFEYATHFMGRPGHLMKVIVGVLRVQYADFFGELPAGFQNVKSQVMGTAEAGNATTQAQ